MSTEQPSVELTTRDVFLQVDRRLSLIEGDLRSLDDKVEGVDTGLSGKIEALDLRLSGKLEDRIDSLRSEMTAGFARVGTKVDTLDAKFDTLHLGTTQTTHTLTQDILSVRQEVLAVRQDLRALELRLTVRLGGMMAVGITVIATLVKLL